MSNPILPINFFRKFFILLILGQSFVQGITSPYAKTQRDYRDVDYVRDSSSLSIDSGEDYDQYDDEYYEDYDYITNPSTFGEPISPDNCTDYSETGYKCVPYYNCENGVIITDGGGIVDIRIEDERVVLDPANSICPGLLEVCCRNEDYFEQPVIKNEEITRSNEQANDYIEDLDLVSEETLAYEDYYIEETSDAKNTTNYECGVRNERGVEVMLRRFQFRAPRTITGNAAFGKRDTQFGEWPHMCALLRQIDLGATEKVLTYICGASLIAPHIVLTAAHCVDKIKAQDLFVKCGEWDTQKANEPKGEQTRHVKQISIHPAYRRRGVHNDLAILHVNRSYDLDEHINPICLPTSKRDDSFDRKNCIATGWGKDKFGDVGLYQNILKQVEMDLVNSTDCEKILKTTRLGRDFKLRESFLCAGGEEGVDTCTGDGGGPLMCQRKDDRTTYVQVGIVSWGIGCFTKIPGVYADVGKATCFIDWAARCVDGTDIDNFGTSNGCAKDWAQTTYCDYKARINYLESELDNLTIPKERGRNSREIYELRKLLRPFEIAITNCKHHGSSTFDCSDSRGR